MPDKKPLALKLIFDVKTVQKCVFALTEKVMTESEIEKIFYDTEPVIVDVSTYASSTRDDLEAAMGMVALMISTPEISKHLEERK